MICAQFVLWENQALKHLKKIIIPKRFLMFFDPNKSKFFIMFLNIFVKSSIRLNFCESYNDIADRRSIHFKSLVSILICVLTLNISQVASAQSDQTAQESKIQNLNQQMNVVISASSSIAVDRFYGKALGLTRLPDVLIDNAYSIMRYQLEDSNLRAELHFVIAREKLPKLKGGANLARGIRLLSINLPQEVKTEVLRRLHVTGRNPTLEAKTFASGEAYQTASVLDADGNQIQIQFVDNKNYLTGRDRFRLGLLVENKNDATKIVDKIIKWLQCEPSLPDTCEAEAFAMQFFQASNGLDVWSATPDKKIGFSLIQIQIQDLKSKYSKFSNAFPEFSLQALSDHSTTGLKVKNAFLLTGPDGILIEFYEM